MNSLIDLQEPVRRVVVLRALGLGDMICAVPALRALRAAFPHARISLLGLPRAREFLSRCAAVDEWLGFPGWPGMPEQALDVARVPGFLAEMQARHVDLAVQLHGNGSTSNGLVALLGAQRCAGFHAPGGWVPPGQEARFRPWPEQGHESERLLSLCRHLGLPTADERLEFPLRPQDHEALLEIWPDRERGQPYVCLHAGAQLASRRWPALRFAAVADALADAGYTVVLTGSPQEQALGALIASAMQTRCVNLVGLTGLWPLGALIAGARCLISNDTGVSHIAAALAVPSLIVSSGGDAQRWAPANRQLHRVLSKPAPCRPCAHDDCPTGHGCAHALSVVEVLQALQDLLDLPSITAPHPPVREDILHGPTPAHPDLARPRQLSLQPDPGSA